MRQGGRLIAVVLGLSLLSARGSQEPQGYGRDLLSEAPLAMDRDADGTPDAWRPVMDPGFRVFMDSVRVVDGGALLLALNGRDVGIETAAPLRLSPASSYRLEGSCRLERLRDGHAEVVAIWLDAEGMELDREIRGVPGGPVHLELTPPEGALGLRLRLQARGREVFGKVRFEELRLRRQPGLRLDGLPTARLFPETGIAGLSLELRGLEAGRHRIKAALSGLDGRVAWTWTLDRDMPSGDERLPLPDLTPAPGWYRLRVALEAGGEEVALRETPVAVLARLPTAAPEGPCPREAGWLGIHLRPEGLGAPDQMAVLDQLRPSMVAAEVWTPGYRVDSIRWGENPADALFRAMPRIGTRCVGLLGVPPAGADPYRTTVLRYWGEVDAWAFIAPEGGWPAMLERWKAVASWAGDLPHGGRWGAVSGERLPDLPPPSPFAFGLDASGAPHRASGLWRRLEAPASAAPAPLAAWTADLLGTALTGRTVVVPLDGQGGVLDARGRVTPAFLAVRTFSHLLRGAEILGPVHLAEGLESYALDCRGRTLLIGWTEDGASVPLEFPAEHPVTVVESSGETALVDPEDGGVRITFGAMPRACLVESGGWMKTRRSVRLEGAVAAARDGTPCRLVLENGFSGTLSGTLALTPPPGWRVIPERLAVSLAPGESLSAPVTLLPYAYEVTGEGREKRLLAELRYGDAVMTVPVAFPFGPRELRTRVSTVYERERDLIRVSQTVLNAGNVPLACDAFLTTRGRPEERRPLGRLEPGESRLVEYAVPYRDLASGDTLVGAREIGGARRFAVEGLRGE